MEQNDLNNQTFKRKHSLGFVVMIVLFFLSFIGIIVFANSCAKKDLNEYNKTPQRMIDDIRNLIPDDKFVFNGVHEYLDESSGSIELYSEKYDKTFTFYFYGYGYESDYINFKKTRELANAIISAMSSSAEVKDYLYTYTVNDDYVGGTYEFSETPSEFYKDRNIDIKIIVFEDLYSFSENNVKSSRTNAKIDQEHRFVGAISPDLDYLNVEIYFIDEREEGMYSAESYLSKSLKGVPVLYIYNNPIREDKCVVSWE